jgi:glycosyltransferase involved in cell wall biosynthesis
MGRETLAQAINSVVDQSFTDWEIVVVNASGRPLPWQPDARVPGCIRRIEPGQPLERSEAANALLQAAQGRYALFLDDDDWLLPEHLARLVATLDADPALVAAYADVQAMTGPREQRVAGHVFALDFDPVRLQLENFLPIHAVLFRRGVAEQSPACRFDTGLQLFEDWDFWLQLAERGGFRRVPGVSAIYALSADEGSGHAQLQSDRRQRMLEQLAIRQLARWTPTQVVALMQSLAVQTQQLNQERQVASVLHAQLGHERQMGASLQDRLVQERQVVASLQEQLGQEREAVAQQVHHIQMQQHELNKLEQLRGLHLQQLLALNTQLEALHQSRSWRITRPLRGLSRLLAWLRSAQPQRLVRHSVQAVGVEVRRHGWAGFLRRLPYYLRHGPAYLPLLASRPPGGQPADFHAPPPAPHQVRLHPDLTGGGETLDFRVSVVIPTLNAGPEFRWMLRKLRAQKAVREIEIVVVDSGSRDATVDWAHEAGCNVVQILPSEFTHSYARNRGADAASGDYLLFMVQDAYPIGDHWMHGMLRYVLDHADHKLVAASCAEYSRSDSDMMYDSMVNTHYRFLGCLEYDRIGEFQGDDHMALRSQGQLSDVSCLISRECFMRYRYQGDYAEDLDLGIRLIKDGYRVAMLASVKVIHSHNRPAYYYLKRTFVDVIFLVGLFKDFTYPRCESALGLLAGMVSTAAHVSAWLSALEAAPDARPLGEEISAWVQSSRQTLADLQPHAPVALGDERLDAFLAEVVRQHLGANTVLDARARDEARRFADSFLARLEHFNQFATAVYGPQDSLLRHELRDVVRKTFAATAGGALGFFYLDRQGQSGPEADMAAAFHRELKAGV